MIARRTAVDVAGGVAGCACLLALALAPRSAAAQDPALAEAGRARVEALEFEPLRFDPPTPREAEVLGVPVYLLEDPSLPLVDLFVRFEGGYARFGRENYAAATALPGLLRSGGTRGLQPTELEERLESLAMQTSFGGSGGVISSSLNTLVETLGPALDLWWSMIAEPRFDTAVVEVWRGRQLESVLRRTDDPASLAFSEFNRLMYGDHPIGWEMTADDLAPDALTPERLHQLHARIVCRDNLVFGAAGDVEWSTLEPLIRGLLERVPSCEGEVPDAPDPEVRQTPGVFLIPKALDQSTVVAAHATRLRQTTDPEWFASRIGNAILGASGFSSRLMSQLRTERGYAYSAASLWTTPREHDGLVGATTRTGSGTTVAALELMLDIFAQVGVTPPEASEVEERVAEFVNGFVFAFESPAAVVARQMTYRATDFPADWLERYVEGIQAVTPEAIRAVFEAHLDPARMTILVVGDPDRLDAPLESLGLGEVTVLDPDSGAGGGATSGARPSAPSGSPRSRR